MKIRCAYCGTNHSVPRPILLLLNMFTDKYYFTCQKCLRYNCYCMYLRIYHDSTDPKEKMANKLEKRVR